jgi:hypothetical protein
MHALELLTPHRKRGQLVPIPPPDRAPISAKGLITRDIGRDRKELSPVTVKNRPGWDAKIPNIRRIVVPELPASKISAGSRRWPKPIP